MRLAFLLSWLILALGACAPALVSTAPPPSVTSTLSAPTQTLTASPLPAPSASATSVPSPTVGPPDLRLADYPEKGYGPARFPANINPLTGLEVGDLALLDRRPMLIKVSNLPREVRPQWGLNFADHVYEYYTEEGTTRFAAVFYGQESEMVGPIRSGRLVDHHLINMYKANFAFGSADYRVRNLLYNQDYADRLVIEALCPPMCRYEPKGMNHLYTTTITLNEFINQKKVPGGNKRQNLDGFLFNPRLPTQGQPAEQVFIRYSAAIYNRWDYDPATGQYLRFVDTQNDFDNRAEVYAPLLDRLNKQQIRADNLLVLYITHEYFSKKPEIVDIVVSGPGKAYLFRDGQQFSLTWYRNGLDKLFTLADEKGQLFPLRPGNTWFEIIGSSSKLTQLEKAWRFAFQIP